MSSHRRLPVVCLILVLLAFSESTASDAWPTYLGDAARSGFLPNTLPTALHTEWVYEAPATPQLAWTSAEGRVIEEKVIGHRTNYDAVINAIVADGNVYFGSSVDHHLYCVDLESGQTKWSFATGGPIRLAPTFDSGRVYIGSDDGYVFCLDANQGKLIWKHRAAPRDEWLLARGEMISRWPVRTGVLVVDGVAYFGAGIFPHEDVFLVALDATTGAVVWKRDNISQVEAGQDDLSPQGYLLANDKLLIVPSGGSLPAVFERATGRLIYKEPLSWRGEAGGAVGGTRVHLFRDQILASGPHHYVAMQQDSGKAGYGWFPGRQLAIDAYGIDAHGDDHANAVAVDGSFLQRYNVDTYAEASRFNHEFEDKRYELWQKLQAEATSPVGIRRALQALGTQRDNLLQASMQWKVPCEHDSALLMTENLVVVGGDGQVTAYDAQTGQSVWNAAVDGEARGLAAADQHLLVSTTTGKIYAFGANRAKPNSVDTAVTPTVPNEPVAATTGGSASDRARSVTEAVTQLSESVDMRRGFCLVVGLQDGRLLSELAQRTGLRIYAVDPDADKVDQIRSELLRQRIYGHRVSVATHPYEAIPYSNYFANVILSESNIEGAGAEAIVPALARFLKPFGGVVALRGDNENLLPSLQSLHLSDESRSERHGDWSLLTRLALPGAANWSHQYGNSGNTGSTGDTRLKSDLGVLWYGDPGPGKMINRHDGAIGPVAAGGRFFIQGVDSLLAYDAYNGTFLWERSNPEAIRTGVFQNVNPGNLAADDERVFVMLPDVCMELAAATGEVIRIHPLPVTHDAKTYEWGYVGFENGMLVGTATVREEIEERLRRRGRTTNDTTDAIFGIDLETGQPLWKYDGQSISHHTIALSDSRVIFIDSSVTSPERERILREDKSKLKDLTGEARDLAEDRLKRQDVRMAVALDIHTGDRLWNTPVDVTDCSDVGIGGGKLTLMNHDGVILLCGANANGHYWKQFVAGEFKQRRIVALREESGSTLWAKDANYRHRPIVVGDKLLAEPWMLNLQTGEQLTRPHPVTGEQVPWSVMRTGHHCGMVTATSDMLLFRSGFTGFYDLNEDTGIRHFAGHRLGCWINAIPANGLVVIPEASVGCVCQFSISSTVVLEPRAARRPWSIASSVGSTTPVKRLTINFGAPGDRRDAQHQLWVSYPRNLPYKETSLELELDLGLECAGAPRYVHVNDELTSIENGEPAWIYTSAIANARRMAIPLLGITDTPGNYHVTLHWAELEDVALGSRRFDVKVQGDTVLRDFDVAESARGLRRAVSHRFGPIAVTDKLILEFIPALGDSAPQPILNAVDIERVAD